MFKHGVTIGPVGNVRPCCMYMNQDLDKRYNDEGWREEFDQLYEESLTKWLPNCYECKAEEDRGENSLRMDANRWFEGTEGIQYWDLKLHNTCNLTCVMCNPVSSSKWQTLVNNNPEEEWLGVVKKEAQMKTGWHKDILPLMMEQLYDTKYLKFTGGEPLMIPHVRKIIKKLYDEEVSPAVRLSIITNGTIPLDAEMLKMLLTFKRVLFIVSVDGLGERFEYIRQGSNWQEVEKNLQQFKKIETMHNNFGLKINFLPMAVNAAQHDEAEQWAKKNKYEFSHSVEIYRPKYLTYASLNAKLRDRYNITSHYEYDEEQYQQLLKHMAIKDKLSGTNFKSACPEFFEDE